MKKFFSSISNVLLLGFALYVLATRAPQWWALYQEKGQQISRFQVLDLQTQTLKYLPPEGEKSVLIFWATWCGPCSIELDRLQSAVAEGKINSQNIYAISLQEDPALVSTEIQKRGYQFLVYADPTGESLRSVKVYGTPTTYFLSSKNEVEKTSTGISPLFIQNIQKHFELKN